MIEYFLNYDWRSFLLNFGGTTVILTGIISLWYKYRLKSSIQHEYSKKLQVFKSELKIEQEVALESVRRLTIEHQVTFSNLQEKRFDKIENLYLSLFKMDSLLGGENEAKCPEDLEDFEKKFTLAINELSDNAIKTYPYVNSTIEETLKEMCENGYKYHAQLLTNLGYSDNEGNSPIDLTNEEFDQIVVSLEKSIKVIGRELKLITGVENDEANVV